jgi:hypothetical protein
MIIIICGANEGRRRFFNAHIQFVWVAFTKHDKQLKDGN